jgi:hypothetical protein
MKDKEVCEYCEDSAKFNDVGLTADEKYSIVGVCEHHLANYGVS